MTQLEYALKIEERIRTSLGDEELLNNILLALSVDEKIDILHYIARCFDVDIDDIQERL